MSRFNIPLQELADKVKLDLDTVTRKATLDMFRAVSFVAPVDTGRYRANMNVTYNTIDRSVTQSTDQSRMGAEIEKVNSFPIGGVTYITNSLPYASVIEFGGYPNPPKVPTGKTVNGYSRQAPQGVFRITVMQFNDYVKKAIAKK